jgi:hypothetical protein
VPTLRGRGRERRRCQEHERRVHHHKTVAFSIFFTCELLGISEF